MRRNKPTPFKPEECLIEYMLNKLVDADTASFTKIMEAFALTKVTEGEKAIGSAAIQTASGFYKQYLYQRSRNRSGDHCLKCRGFKTGGRKNRSIVMGYKCSVFAAFQSIASNLLFTIKNFKLLIYNKTNMKKIISFALTCLITQTGIAQEQKIFTTPYGNNISVGKYASVNGINMYYEIYGEGMPMVLVHGNGGNVASMANQIEYFKSKYKIIVADSRAQGKSSDTKNLLTYEQITDDWAALLDQLHIDSAYFIGWSDGGIESLLMAIRHPNKVKMMAIMGANLQPDSSAVYGWAVRWVKNLDSLNNVRIAKKDTLYNYVQAKKMFNLLGQQPHIPLAAVQKIKAPTLVMSGDKDVIKEAHTLQIYQNLQKAWLCIFPGGTHMMPETDPDLFNATVEKFFSKPYYRPDTKTVFGIKD